MLAKAAPQVVQIRPGWFQENWLEALQTARNDAPFFETHFTPADHPIPMVSEKKKPPPSVRHRSAKQVPDTSSFAFQVSIADTASIVAQHVVETGSALPTSPYAFEIHGPRGYSMLDLQHALATVTGRALPRIDAIEPDRLIDFFKRKLPASKAREVAEMTLALNGGGLLAAQMAGEIGHGAVRGETELVDTLSRLQSGEVAKAASGAF